MNKAVLKKRKTIQKTTFGRVFVFVFLSIWCVLFFGLLAWLFINSFKDRVQYVTDKVGLPAKWKFSNYIDSSKSLSATDKSVPAMLWNTMWRILGSMFLSNLSSHMVAYTLAKYKFRGRNALYWTAILITMIPIYGSMGSALKVYSALGMYDTPLYILSAVGIGGILIPYSCYRSLSWDYAEAAFIDGAGHFTVFFKVMLPQMTPIITALAVTGFVAAWNDYMTPLVYLPSYPSLATGLYIYEVECQRTMNYPILFCGLIMSILPVLVLFIAFQNTFMELDIGGGLKG